MGRVGGRVNPITYILLRMFVYVLTLYFCRTKEPYR